MALFHTTVVDNQIKALPTIGSASGLIATFDTDRAENLVNLEVAITATGGGGTPASPLPITGFSQADISVCGKNLFDINALTATGITISGNSAVGLASKFSAFGSGININIPKTTVLTLSVSGYTEANQGTNGAGVRFRVKYTDNTETELTFLNTVTSVLRQSITTESGKTISYIYIDYGSNGNNIWHFSDFQLEIGSTSSEFEPYNGTTETIPFGQTVYGGRLNVGSGVLTITHGYDLLSNLNWSAVGDRFYADPSNILKADGITTNSSHYAPIANIADGGAPMSDLSICAINRGTNDRLYIKDTRFSDVPTFVSTMGNVQIIYELETPLTIQLDSKQIQTIANSVNNIYADTGDIIDLKFVLSVGQAIS